MGLIREGWIVFKDIRAHLLHVFEGAAPERVVLGSFEQPRHVRFELVDGQIRVVCDEDARVLPSNVQTEFVSGRRTYPVASYTDESEARRVFDLWDRLAA